MKAGTAHYGRTILAALTAAVLVLSMVTLFASPAEGQQGGNPPSVECADVLWNGEYWKTQVGGDGQPSGTPETSGNIDDGDIDLSITNLEVSWTNNSDYAVFRIVEKGGQYDQVNNGLWQPGDGGTFGVEQSISHITFCFTSPTTTTSTSEPTTTTSEPTTTSTTEPTTTTSEPTTTTSEPTTTTSEPTTTTSEPTTTTTEQATTTTPPPTTTEPTATVRALVFVTVEGECKVVDGKGEGEIDVTISVDDGATVVISDGDGDVVATVSSDTVITVPEDDTYTWDATPSEGFEFAEDFVSSGEVEIDECTPEEVKDLEVLPFTGVESDSLAVVAAVLSTIGLLVLLATRRVED